MKDLSFLTGQQPIDLFASQKKEVIEDEVPPQMEKKRSHKRRQVKRDQLRRGRDNL